MPFHHQTGLCVLTSWRQHGRVLAIAILRATVLAPCKHHGSVCMPAFREQQKRPACVALLLLSGNYSLASCSLSGLSKLALRLYVHAGRWEQQKSERRPDRLLAETPLGSPPAPPPAPSGPGALLGFRDRG